MASDHGMIRKSLSRAMSGSEAHVELSRALEGLGWEDAGRHVTGIPHTIYQLVNHMIYWQRWTVEWLDGKDPPLPEHAPLGWPGDNGPKDEAEWERTVKVLLDGLEELNRRCSESDLFSVQGNWSALDMLNSIVSHNSYHLGQIVSIRRMLRTWPPPSGGNTW
jgi:hypothetical protein